MRRRCRMCEGLGYREDAHCGACGQRIAVDNEWWKVKGTALPCGHSAFDLVEIVDCLDCWGVGKSWQWVTLEEWRAYRKRWWIKFVVVTLAMAFIIAFPFVFVWLTPLGSDVCGSWWYWMIPVLLVWMLR